MIFGERVQVKIWCEKYILTSLISKSILRWRRLVSRVFWPIVTYRYHLKNIHTWRLYYQLQIQWLFNNICTKLDCFWYCNYVWILNILHIYFNCEYICCCASYLEAMFQIFTRKYSCLAFVLSIKLSITIA